MESDALPGGSGFSAPPPFRFDFNTLFDMIERRSDGAVADWHMAIRRDKENGRMFLKAIKGKGVAAEVVRIEGIDFDAAASELAPKLHARGLLP